MEDDYDEFIGTTMNTFVNDSCESTFRPGRRKNKNRNYAQAYETLLDDYFRKPDDIRLDGSGFMRPRFTEEDLERRFGMPRDFFDRRYKMLSKR